MATLVTLPPHLLDRIRTFLEAELNAPKSLHSQLLTAVQEAEENYAKLPNEIVLSSSSSDVDTDGGGCNTEKVVGR